jgi:lysophospholipase L1-like esterase
MNQELQTMVVEMNRNLKNYPNVRLEYSPALADVDVSNVQYINPADAWHPSIKGHNLLAEAVFKDLNPSLKFLGMLPK